MVLKSKISVIVPAFQAEKTIQRSVNSILAQEFTNLELIIIDDASSDHTWNVIKELEQIDSRILGIRLVENLGPAGARNAGIAKAKGEFLAFLDADDEWISDKLGRQAEFLLNNPDVDVIFTDCTNINISNNVSKKLSEINGDFLSRLTFRPVSGYPDFFILEGAYRQEMYRKFFILISSVLMRRSSFDRINGFSPNRFGTEDVDFFVRLSSWVNFAFWDQEKVLRYQSDSGISSISEKWLNELSMYHKMCLSSAEYEDLHRIALHNLLKTYRSLIVFYAMRGMPTKAFRVFRESLNLGFYLRLAVYAIMSFAGPLPFRIGYWLISLRLRFRIN